MKSPVRLLRDAQLAWRYPIEGKTPGWRFRLHETSNGAWLAQGCDGHGREVGCQGTDPEEMLAALELEVAKINAQVT